MTYTAIDVSSHQGSDIGSLIDQFQPSHVIVKLYLPQELGSNGAAQYTIPQARTARDKGCSLGGYVWGYADLDPTQTVRDAKALADLVDIELPLWLDIETYVDSWTGDESIPDLAWIAAAEAEAARLEVPLGLYTSREMWRRCTGDGDDPSFNHLPLWAAQYSPPTPDIDDYAPFGGWAPICHGRQWTSTPIDQNVFRSGNLTDAQSDEIKRIKGIFQSWSTNMAQRSVQAESWGYGIQDTLSARMAGELQGAVDGLDWVLQQG